MIDIEKCRITYYPTQVLLQKAEPVEEVTEDIRKIVSRMIDIMLETKGVGLAGPQARVPLQIFVASVDGTRENARVYINPEITTSGPLDANEEGCLSLPGIAGKIKRFKECTITATDMDGNRFTEEAQGLQVRGFQHEYDHLQGMLIKDRMGRAAMIGARRQLKRLLEGFEKNKS